MAKSSRPRRQSFSQPRQSNRDQATTTRRPAIAAYGIMPSSVVLAVTSTSSQADANTAANGVFAPASKFGIDRFIDPHDT